MSRNHLKNIALRDFRKFLKHIGCEQIRSNGGHEVWAKKEMPRPITIQSHIDPIPEFIVQNCQRNLGMSKETFFEIFNQL